MASPDQVAAAGGLVEAITPGQPAAVLPQETKQAPPVTRKRPPTRKLKPGDLVCGDCGEGNLPTRKFCSRCGFSLAEADIVKTPWWRRLLPRTGAKVRKSGERPKGRRGKSKLGQAVSATFRVLRRVVSVLLLVGGIVYGVSGDFRGWVNARAVAAKQGVERMIFPQYTPVSPVQVSATSELPDHPGALAVDGLSNTFWAAPRDGPEPTVVLRYDRPVSLARAIVRTGARDEFQTRHRAEQLHLVFSTGRTADVTLKDNPDPQQVDIENGAGVEWVEIHVVKVFQSVKGTDVAVTEIELFQES
ncbi:zinc ribbon domain-containing protein [Actinokineospora sp. NBRC 105648]|uniref:zinc ribbon domain-containing protein n=1 Tax=Actinokineospora sp. NBRC 105648 TaxID=3032206 RepID=UPI0024A05815|nr:zinc ribbon domain-containing protein [Actinokineospora sp. NBRC 105648]GLZ39464.1 zinc ribbon domain-containing protein [Actinokineospora sp. NBRC 105648]